jgi:dCMP deaminase
MPAGEPEWWNKMMEEISKSASRDGYMREYIEEYQPNFYSNYADDKNLNMNYIENWDEIHMRSVYNISWKSKDPKTKIGAVLIRDNIPVIQCFNGFARKVKDLPERYNNRELKRKMVAHAEENTVLLSARLGKSSDNTVCYTQGVPCAHCAIALINGGISEIVIHKQWPNLIHSQEWVDSVELSKQMLTEANINIKVFDKVLGLEGFLDGKIINV